MAHNKAYLICENKCMVPGYSKDEIDALLRLGVSGIIDANTGERREIWVGTTAEYNALENIDPKNIYIKTDVDTVPLAENATNTDFTNGEWISVHGTDPRVLTDNLVDGATYQLVVDEGLLDGVGKPSAIFLFTANSDLILTIYRDNTDYCEIRIEAGSHDEMLLSVNSTLYGEESQDASLKKFKYRRIR